MRHTWLVVALVLGAALGLYIAHDPQPAREQPAQPEIPEAANPPAPPAAPPVATGPASAAPVEAGRAHPVAQTREPDYTGYQQSIDVGPVFRQQFEQAASTGNQDSLALAHRELEREMRDDTWAYAIEAEIENSLVAETSLGNFRRDHVECRATMCEVRLSGEGDDQMTALQNWNENLGGKPWAARLFITHSSTITDNGKVFTLMIFRRQPAAPPSR